MSRVNCVLAKIEHFNKIVRDPLKQYPCFLLTGPDKKPCDVKGTWLKGWNLPENQFSFEDAARLAAEHDKEIGFAFSDRHNIIGYDLDNCYDPKTGQWTETGLYFLNLLNGAGFEFSRSGRGCHFFASYSPELLPDLCSRKNHGTVEQFVNSGYIVLTGNGKQGDVLKDISSEIIEIQNKFFSDAGSRQDTVEDNRTLSSSDLPDSDYKRRLTANAEFKLDNQSGHLTTLPEGRRQALNAAVFSLAPHINHSDLSLEIVREDLWNACQKNGITEKPGKPMTRKEFETIFNDAYTDSVTKNPGVPVLKDRIKTPVELMGSPDRAIADYERLTSKKTKPAPELPPISVEKGNIYKTLGEADIADRFVDLHGETMRYVSSWNRWMFYEGNAWHSEKTDYAYSCVRQIMKEVIDQNRANLKPQEIRDLKKTSYRNAAVTAARADRRIAATADQWDKDIYLLNTPNETIDLKTGELRPHNPEDYLTNQTTVGVSSAQCPKWRQFLQQITLGDTDYMNYLQRLAGYCLTGSTREQSLFFLFGSGRNGKGVFIDTLAYLLGEGYRKTAASKTFTVQHNEEHSTVIAHLRGARLVTASEIEPGKRWAESRIKELTGEDRIAARFTGCDVFEFQPQCTILISANNKPKISNVDPAIRDRIKILPFMADFTNPLHQNKNLREELKAEAGAILWWAVQGAVEWYRNGLNTPKVVLDHTVNYLDSEDHEGRWIKENIVRDFKAETTLIDLYSNWQTFAIEHQTDAKKSRDLSERLERENYIKGKQPGTKRTIFKGIRIRTPFDCTDDENNVVQFPGS